MEAMLRQADASVEKWFRAAKTRSARLLRQRVDDLQAELKKLGGGLAKLEKEPIATPSPDPAREPKVTVSKRRARPATTRKPSAARKHKKAA